MKAKYPNGTRVKVKVGHIFWSNKKDSTSGKYLGKEEEVGYLYDMAPHYTEDIATIEYTYGEKSETDDRYSKGKRGYTRYCLKFDKYGSVSWFDEDNIIPIEE